MLSRIPGHNTQGELELERLLSWINQVRASCAELARVEACDLQIGKLFSKAPIGNDGVWPCEPLREVIEQIATEELEEGITSGLFNSRGVHWRGEGGEQERQLAAKYAAWAQALQFTYPRVAKILREMEQWYQHGAKQEDADAEVRKRLGQ
jgi:hypothetical protein